MSLEMSPVLGDRTSDLLATDLQSHSLQTPSESWIATQIVPLRCHSETQQTRVAGIDRAIEILEGTIALAGCTADHRTMQVRNSQSFLPHPLDRVLEYGVPVVFGASKQSRSRL